MSLHPDIVSIINSTFNEADIGEAVKVLEHAEIWQPDSGPLPRIHLAHIWHSKGNIDGLISSVKYYSDWRDLLINVGLADDDWRVVAARKGVDCAAW